MEEVWVKKWEEAKIFEANVDESRAKVFVTFPFPYMNGPLHLGHAFTATRVDVYARFKRMQGYNVLFPWAWHWTGQPIVAAAERLARGDPDMIREFKEIDKVPDEELKRFTDPVYMAKYYTDKNREAVKLLGFSIDWRREFHTTSYHPHFSKFIEWQYLKLRSKGYVVRGTHPVVWCPHCKSPTGDHDRLKGEGVAPEEYYLVMFKLVDEDKYLVAATFRPETIFGTTNVWLNPKAKYVEAKVDDKIWIISKEAASKLREQLRNVTIIKEFEGRSLIGRECVVPIVNSVVLILPAEFVDPESASGVVYSVPGHAPYDWLALRDILQGKVDLKEYGIDLEKVKNIKPISIIAVPGYGEFPAIEVVDKLKVKDQYDPKAEEATKEIYKKEFHMGIMKDNCGVFKGLSVSEAKKAVHEELTRLGLGSTMYDLPEPVICRCTTKCIVKVLQDQWFLKYSDPNWKEKGKRCVSKMKIYPEEARRWFISTIDWLKEWPCARRTGLGTPLPWNKEWIIETLSDSTVYMAFYTIAHIIKEEKIRPEQLLPEVFDYVYYGIGRVEEIEKLSGIKKEVLNRMRKEFLYWYPVDLRNSAKELVPNHLTFFILQHVALFPEEYWPKAIGVNGMVMMEGMKMAKSTGNIMTIRDAISLYGSDTVRATLLLSAEDMDDPDWRSKNAKDLKEKIESLKPFILKLLKEAVGRDENYIDRWLLSRMNRRISEVTEALDQLRTRTALHKVLFETLNDLKWYIRRTNPRRETIEEFIDIWVRMMSPFIPFTAEEIYEALSGKGFVSIAPWPKIDEDKIDYVAELMELAVVRLIEDLKEIMRVLKVQNPKAKVYVASKWKFELAREVARLLLNREEKKIFTTTKNLLPDIPVSEKMKVVKALIRYLRELGEENLRYLVKVSEINETKALESAKNFICKELSLRNLEIYTETDAPLSDRAKADKALPLRPSIIIEEG